MNPVTFSVVIPAFNRAASILPTLRSVQAQRFSDFECIVVDDGSADAAQLRDVVAGLDDLRFRYHRRPNGGGGAARNTGIAEAQGEWVAFLDSDDIWLPEKLAADYACLAEGTVLFSPVTVMRGGLRCGTRPARAPFQDEHISEYLSCGQGWTQTSTLVVPAGVRSRFCEWAPFGQDTDFALRLAAEGFRLRMLPRSYVCFVDDEGARVSRNADWRGVDAWLAEVAPLMTAKAFLAYRGWQVARIAAANGELGFALQCYMSALLRGAMPPPLAFKALLQILVRRRTYRAAQLAFGSIPAVVRP